MNKELFLERLKRHDGALFGRDKEVGELKTIFNAAVEGKRPKAVFVNGYSGTGKSKLVHHAYERKEDGTVNGAAVQLGTGYVYFAEGKYDQLRSARPYAGLIDACCGLTKLILANCQSKNSKRQAEKHEAIAEHLQKSLVNDLHLLVNLMPELTDLMPKDTASASPDTSSAAAGTHQFDQLKVALASFFAGVSKFFPVVLFIDDLQWADSASIDILESLLSKLSEDGNDAMFVLVGAYRSNELVGDHPLVDPIQKGLECRDCSIKMPISDLDLESLNAFVASMLKYEEEPETTRLLSKALHKCTNGNIFFALQFLEMLVTSNVMKFSFVTMKWTWDEAALLEKSTCTDNVTDLVIARMRRLPPDTALALIIASQLGSRFDAYTVSIVLELWKDNGKSLNSSWQDSQVHFDPDPDFDPLAFLEVPIQEGFIIATTLDNMDGGGGTWYKFLHDRIQQAAGGLIDDKYEMSQLRLRLGLLLLDVNKRERKTWAVLSAVDLLNSVVDLVKYCSEERRLQLAEANVETSQIAASQSAFFAGADYLAKSRALLGNGWTENYALTLKVYSWSAEMAYCCGNLALCEEMYEEIKSNRRTERDSWLASYTLMKALGSEARYKQCIDLCYEVLNEAGFYMPKAGAAPEDVGRVYGEVVAAFEGMTNEEILALPVANLDETTTLVWRILSSAFLFVWHDNRLLDHAFICCSMTLKTLKEGISAYSGQSFAVQSISCIVNMHFPLVKRLFQLWTHPKISCHYTGKEVHAGTFGAGYAASAHLFSPLTKVAEGGLKGYEAGMKTGSIEWAITDAGVYLLSTFMSGLPLHLFEAECWGFVKEMKVYENRIHRPMCEMYLQVALNLMDKGNGPNLTGEATKEYDMSKVMDGSEPHFPVQVGWFAQLMLSIYYKDFETAAAMAVKHEDFGALEWPLVWSVPHPFFRGLAYVGKVKLLQAKQTAFSCGWGGRRKEIAFYKARAKSSLDLLRGYAENGLINTVHMFLLLKAEVATITKGANYSDIKVAYKEAFRSASRSGFGQDAALTSERMAAFLFEKEPVEARLRIMEAIDLYEKWGAAAKVKLLQQEYDGLLEGEQQDHSCSSSYSMGGHGSRSSGFGKPHRTPMSRAEMKRRRATVTQSMTTK